MRTILILFTLTLITFKASSQEEIESTTFCVQDIELHSEAPSSGNLAIKNITNS